MELHKAWQEAMTIGSSLLSWAGLVCREELVEGSAGDGRGTYSYWLADDAMETSSRALLVTGDGREAVRAHGSLSRSQLVT